MFFILLGTLASKKYLTKSCVFNTFSKRISMLYRDVVEFERTKYIESYWKYNESYPKFS